MKYKDFDNNGMLEGVAISNYGNENLISISDAEYDRLTVLLALQHDRIPEDIPVELYHKNIEEVKVWY